MARQPSPPPPPRQSRRLATLSAKIADGRYDLVDERAELMAALVADGYSMRAIADAAGLHPSAVQKSLRRYELRRGEALAARSN